MKKTIKVLEIFLIIIKCILVILAAVTFWMFTVRDSEFQKYYKIALEMDMDSLYILISTIWIIYLLGKLTVDVMKNRSKY